MAMIAQGDQQDNDFVSAFYKGKQAGIREVVEWIERHRTITYGKAPLRIKCQSVNPVEWQAQLKKWGL